MRFKVTIGDFLKQVQKTLPAVAPKSTLPVLEHLHFTIADGTLKMVATDQDIVIQNTMQVFDSEDGGVLVPARKLSEIIKALDSQGEIEFSVDNETYDIVISKGKGKYRLKGIDPDEFLDIPELFENENQYNLDDDGLIEGGTPTASFFKEDLIKLCEKTYYAVSTDSLRPAMLGVYFQFRETYVNAVSTDSFRLAKSTIYSLSPVFPQDFNVIIPIKSVEFLKKVDADVKMTVIEMYGKITHLKFDFGTTTFITKIIDEKFPPYEAVIPLNNPIEVMIEKKLFYQTVKRVSLLSNSFEQNQVTITAEDEDSGTKGSDVIPCELNQETFNVAYNHKYLEDALATIDDDTLDNGMIKFTFLDSTKPSLLLPTNDKNEQLILIMPVRIPN